jgi:hypothetical protein
MSGNKMDPEFWVSHYCRDQSLRALLVRALHSPGVRARCTARGVLMFGPDGSTLVSANVSGGDPNQVKRTRGQLRRIGIVL